MINKERFLNTLKQYDIEISDLQFSQLDKYAEILVDYNEKVNLTAITDPEGIENKHFLDSLLFDKNPLVKGKVVDVGTGAGFPSLPIKIVRPDIDITMVDSLNKRIGFLNMLCDQLKIKSNNIHWISTTTFHATLYIWISFHICNSFIHFFIF